MPPLRNGSIPSLVGSTQQSATSGTVGATYTFTPHVANEFNLNYTRGQRSSLYLLDTFGGAVPITAQALNAPYAGFGTSYATFSLSYNSHSELISIGDANITLLRQYQLTDHVSYTLGKHTFKAGADIRLLAPIYQPVGYQGTYSFYSAANVLNGTLSNYTLTSSLEEHLHYHYFSLFAQDSWRPTQRLTLDYGIRWDLDPPPSEESGRRPALIIVPDQTNLSTVRLATPSDPYYKTSLGAVAPRFGGAYILHTTPGLETVVRGGIGLYFDPNNDLAAAGYSSAPFVNSLTVSTATPYPLPAAKAVPPGMPTLALPVSLNLPSLEPNLSLPFNVQWNVTLQQALHGQTLSIAYVGSTGQRLLTTQQLNAAQPSTATTTFPRPNPNFGLIQYSFNEPTSDYHSLQLQVLRPMRKGLQLLANYTWSHSIDTISNDFSVGALDRASSDFDVRNNFTAALLYTPTFQLKGSGFVHGVASHLATAGICQGSPSRTLERPVTFRLGCIPFRRTDSRSQPAPTWFPTFRFGYPHRAIQRGRRSTSMPSRCLPSTTPVMNSRSARRRVARRTLRTSLARAPHRATTFGFRASTSSTPRWRGRFSSLRRSICS